MFSTMHGDEILATDTQNVPTRNWQPRAPRGGAPPPPQQIREMFFSVTRSRATGEIFVKVVNVADRLQPLAIQISGAPRIRSDGELVQLAANALTDTNSIEQPRHIVPRTQKIRGLSASFVREFPPFSISILKLRSR
jgi:alpha-N-arabinofuranosidase